MEKGRASPGLSLFRRFLKKLRSGGPKNGLPDVLRGYEPPSPSQSALPAARRLRQPVERGDPQIFPRSARPALPRRLEWKLRITEQIYASHPGDTGRELLRLVDWMMQLPEEEAIIYEEELKALDAEKNMSYIPSFARKSWYEGLAQGQIQGQAQAQAKLLTRLLEKRFGPLPDGASERLEKAETGQVEEWGLRLLDAKSLDEVFGGAGEEPTGQLP